MHRQEQRPSSAALTPRLQGGRLPGGRERGTRGAAWVSPAGLRPEVGLSQESQSRPTCKPSIYIQVRSPEGRGQPGMNHPFVQNMTQLSPPGRLFGERGAGGRGGAGFPSAPQATVRPGKSSASGLSFPTGSRAEGSSSVMGPGRAAPAPGAQPRTQHRAGLRGLR